MNWRMRDAIERELQRREQEAIEDEDDYHYDGSNLPANVAGLITRWHKEMVLRWHPDRGGDNRIMQAINDAADRLRELAGV